MKEEIKEQKRWSEMSKRRYKKERIRQGIVILMTGLLAGMGLNLFLVPSNIFSAGANGIAQILASFLPFLDTGLLILLLNIPIALIGLWKLGLFSTALSFINVSVISICTMLIPIQEVSTNPLMNAIVGGVLIGIGAGYSLKFGFTTGGMDIISLVLAKTTGKTVGNYMLATNGLIVCIAGFLFSWESALYTMISIYCMSYIVDMVHTSHQKVTVLIVSDKAEAIAEELMKETARGLTLLQSYGGFRKQEGRTIMMVTTRYELYTLEKIVTTLDANAFMNIFPTHTVVGRFANEQEQKIYWQTGTFPDIPVAKMKK